MRASSEKARSKRLQAPTQLGIFQTTDCRSLADLLQKIGKGRVFVLCSQSKVLLVADQRSDEQLPEGLAGAPREVPNLRLHLMFSLLLASIVHIESS